jgi:DNA-binding response OmpR family regulator
LNEDQRQEAETCGKDAVQYYLDLPDRGEQPLTAVTTKDICFCIEHRTVDVCGQRIQLTPKEFDILALLITHPRQVFTFDMIIDMVWKEDPAYYSRKTLNSHINNLRKKLEVQPEVPQCIISVHGIGYKFDAG